ncbi:MAG: NERD domain-containing protein [Cytophagales bacterium]|nr:NERD domain-containing protein [Armatimonadota bacterium]
MAIGPSGLFAQSPLSLKTRSAEHKSWGTERGMIVKELDSFVPGEALAKAGRKAEEDLAHYLRRAFKDSQDYLVFNGIRLENDGDAAQMDHLILHRHGVLIVESKSVSSRLRINEQEEWARYWNGDWRGMPSPVKQAERQGEFLRTYLQQFRDYLRAGLPPDPVQISYRCMGLEVLVAISDSGIIDRPPHLYLEKVCKADQVTDRIQALRNRLQEAEKTFRRFSLSAEPPFTLSRDEILRMSQLFVAHHRPSLFPSKAAPTTRAPLPSPGPHPTAFVSVYFCRHCRSGRMEVRHGRYGYYFQCRACGGNTPLRRICIRCGAKEKTRKSGSQFFAECAGCATSYPFHRNTAA